MKAITGLHIRLVRIVSTKVDGDNATVTAVLGRAGQELKQQLKLAEGGRRLEAVGGGLMATVVVKLGSSIVADDAGELRVDVLGALLDEVAARHRAGDARGDRHLRARSRPACG